MDQLYLVVHGKCAFCKVAQEPTNNCQGVRLSHSEIITYDLRYLATGSAGFDFTCSRKDWKSNRGGWSLSTSLAELLGVLGGDPGVCGRLSLRSDWASGFKGDRAGPWWPGPCSCAETPKAATVGLEITAAWSIERGRDFRTGDLGMNVRAIAASPEREGVVDRDIDCARS